VSERTADRSGPPVGTCEGEKAGLARKEFSYGPKSADLAHAAILPFFFFSLFFSLFFFKFRFSFLLLDFKFKFEFQLWICTYIKMCQFTFGDEENVFMYIFIPYVLCGISFLFIFKTLFSNLGFDSTSSIYYLITINIIILFNAQTYKLQHDAFFYHLFELNSKFCVCSFFMMQMRHIK
jgi:hypothetical protein